MKIAINGMTAKTEHDYRYINKLIECFGNLAPDKSFLLIARRGQEDFYIPAPGNFEYRFCKIRLPITDGDNLWIDNLLENILIECECNLLMDFGASESSHIGIPRVSLISMVETLGSGRRKNRSTVTRKRLKLISKTTGKNIEKSRGIVFPTRYLHGEISGTEKKIKKTRATFFGSKPDVERISDRKVLSRYGIADRFFLAPVSSESMKEFSSMLKAYGLALKHSSDIPDLVLVGSDESPAEVGEIMNAINKSAADSKISYVGSIPDEDFMVLQSTAHALIICAEIFDIEEILISAMNSGCAIICVNGPICREITDGAPLYFDPRNWRDLAFKLRLAADDPVLIDFLKSQSREKAARFSWENTTRQMLNFFKDIVSDHQRIPQKLVLKE